MPDRGACRRGSGCVHGRARPGRGARSSRRNGQAGRRNRGSQSGGKHGGQETKRRASCRDTQRVPLRLPEGLRRRADRRRPGAAMSGKEQVETLWQLPAGRQRRRRRRNNAGSGHRFDNRGNQQPCSSARGSAGSRAGAAADAAARRIIRREVGMWRRRSRALRGHRTRRWPHRAMSGDPSRLPFPRLQGSSGSVRGAINSARALPTVDGSSKDHRLLAAKGKDQLD